MDLGISGRRAIVCAASKGLGRACAIALANEGVHVTITARGSEALGKTAAHIRTLNPNVTVTEVVGDITTPEGREAALKACPDPAILINDLQQPTFSIIAKADENHAGLGIAGAQMATGVVKLIQLAAIGRRHH